MRWQLNPDNGGGWVGGGGERGVFGFVQKENLSEMVIRSNYWNEIEVQKVPIKLDKDRADIIT